MPKFIHPASGRTVVAHGPKAAHLDRLTSWEREGNDPAPDPVHEPGDPVHVDRAGRLIAPPPKAGPGSSRDAWADYAASVGVTVDDDATRDDIIAAIESDDAGH